MGDASDSDEDAPKLSKTECPAKLARWLALRFGLLGLDKALRSKAFNALKDARDAFGLVKDPRELETLRRYILKFKGFETDGLQKGQKRCRAVRIEQGAHELASSVYLTIIFSPVAEFSHDQMTKVHMPEGNDRPATLTCFGSRVKQSLRLPRPKSKPYNVSYGHGGQEDEGNGAQDAVEGHPARVLQARTDSYPGAERLGIR